MRTTIKITKLTFVLKASPILLYGQWNGGPRSRMIVGISQAQM